MKQKITYSPLKLLLLWILQVNTSLILLKASFSKLLAIPSAIQLFDTFILWPEGRIFIGTLELLTAILLLSWRFSVTGAILGITIMLGAIIAHITILGISSSFLAILVLIMCSIIFILRRKEAPIIGDQF